MGKAFYNPYFYSIKLTIMMMTQQPATIQLYQILGELFYAIAASDKVVRPAEIKAMRDLVNEKWKALDHLEDEYHSDAAYQIEIVFDWLDDQYLDPEDCFQDFKDFKKEHPKLFTIKIKKLIWETANAIASSFAGLNKSELAMLAKLKMNLEDDA